MFCIPKLFQSQYICLQVFINLIINTYLSFTKHHSVTQIIIVIRSIKHLGSINIYSTFVFLVLQNLPMNTNQNYLQLIDKVGSSGTYQRNVFLMFGFNWFITGIFLLGTSFIFINQNINCLKMGLLANQCNTAVCSLPQSEWVKYADNPVFKSLTIEFGPFLCANQSNLALAKSSTYFGALIGYLVFLLITDNLGRKVSIMFSWSVACIGIGILCLSSNIWMATIGLFLAGAGAESSVKVTMVIFSQILEYNLRQKYSVLIQLFFASGGVFVGAIYFFFQDWRKVTILFAGIPSIILLICMGIYLQQTPKYLFKRGKQNVYRALNRIGKINKGHDNLVTYQDIQQYSMDNLEVVQNNIIITWIDLIRFPSLRSISIPSCLLFFFINYIYFGPLFTLQTLKLDIRVSQVILSGSQLFAYIISSFTIELMPRRISGIIMLGISGILTGSLMLFEEPEVCDYCAYGIVQIIFMFGVRFLVSYYYSIMFVFVVELFPMRARGIGFGTCSAFGALGASTASSILSLMKTYDIDSMILFTVASLTSVCMLLFLRDTHNKPLEDQIEQIKIMKNTIISLKIQEQQKSYLEK